MNKTSRHIFYLPPLIIQFIVRSFTVFILKIFFRFQVEGREHLEGLPKGFIIASNHISELDPILMTLAFPIFFKYNPFYFVSGNKERYKNMGWRSVLYGGFFFSLMGAYSSHSGYKDYEISLRDHVNILKKGGTMCIFPQGKMVDEYSSVKARGGAAYLCYTANVPVVPVTIKIIKLSSGKQIELRVRKPIYPKELILVLKPTVDDFKMGSRVIIQTLNSELESFHIER